MKRRAIGILGEKLARDFLVKRGYRIWETNYRYSELTRLSDELFNSQPIYVLKGIVDVKKILELIPKPTALEDIEMEWGMTDEIWVRQSDELPVRVISTTSATTETLDGKLRLKWQGDTVFFEFNAPIDLPEVEALYRP
ncbi:hypothetical protein ACFLW4_02700 [Chloroflexota bacterium]